MHDVVLVHAVTFVHEIMLVHEVRSMPQQVATALVQLETPGELVLLAAAREAAPTATANANIGIRFFIIRIINVNLEHTLA